MTGVAIGEDTANYDITTKNGDLTITLADLEVEVIGNNAEPTYTGYDQEVKGYTINIPEGATLTEDEIVKPGQNTVIAKGKNVDGGSNTDGTYPMGLTEDQFSSKNTNYTVTFKVTDGWLKITPAELKITAKDQIKTYNAALQGENKATYTADFDEKVTVDKLLGDDKLTSITLDGQEKNVNLDANGKVTAYTGKIVASGAVIGNATGNYTITYVKGNLTINPKAISITADDKTMIYGNAEPILTATTVGLVGTDYIATTQTRVAGKDIGEYTITTTVNEGQDIVKNYKIETLPGTLTINRRPVTVTAADKGKVYGEADPALTATVDGLATGESTDKISYTLSRAAGENVGEYLITPSGAAEQGNYAVAYETGTLTIVPEDTVVVTITAHGDSFKYDGIEKDLSGYDVAINNSLYTEADFTFTGSSELKGKNVGTYRTNMQKSDFENTNANFENVIFVVNNGTLNITPRSITLTSADGEKKYDSTALTNDTVTITGDGFVKGEGVNITVTGRQTAVGESENTFTYAMTSGTRAGNYEITTVYGKLKVTEAPATATGGTGNNAGTEEEEVTYHKLTITYQYEDGTVIKTFTQDYMSGTAYSVTSGKVDGYTPDVAVVKGTMGNNDVNVTVTYSETEYTLTVKYVSLANGTEVAKAVTMKLKAGDNYTVFTPAVEGYTAQADKVTGEMPDSNRTITVFMTPDGAELGEGLGGSTGKGGGYNGVEIDDFGTPLGIADTILGGGEIIE